MGDPVVGRDGLLEPVEPFRTPMWFKILIACAVTGAVGVALIILL